VGVKEKQIANLSREGRKAGSKNKSTLLREVLKNGFEKEMEKDFIQVVRAVVDKAKDGDMTAAKILFDRVIPVTDGAKQNKLPFGDGGLTIVIERLEASPRQGITLSAEGITDADFEEAE